MVHFHNGEVALTLPTKFIRGLALTSLDETSLDKAKTSLDKAGSALSNEVPALSNEVH